MQRRKLSDRREFNYTQYIPERRSGIDRRAGPDISSVSRKPASGGEGFFICSKCGREIPVEQVWHMEEVNITDSSSAVIRVIVLCKDCCPHDQ